MKRIIMSLALVMVGSLWAMDDDTLLIKRAARAIEIKNYLKMQKIRKSHFTYPLNKSSEIDSPDQIKDMLLSYVDQLISFQKPADNNEQFVSTFEVTAAIMTLKYLRSNNVSDDRRLVDLQQYLIDNTPLPDLANQ